MFISYLQQLLDSSCRVDVAVRKHLGGEEGAAEQIR